MAHKKGDHGYCLAETFSWGFKTFFGNFGFFAALLSISIASIFITLGLLYLPVRVLAGQVEQMGFFFWFILFVLSSVSTLFVFWLYLGWIRIQLDFIQEGKSSLLRLFSQGGLVFKGLLLNFIYYLLVAIGLVALILPGIYIWCRLYFINQVMVDKRTGIIDILKTSFAMTKGSHLALFAYTIVSALLTGISGTLLYPIVLLSQGYGYNYLIKKLHGKKKDSSEGEKTEDSKKKKSKK